MTDLDRLLELEKRYNIVPTDDLEREINSLKKKIQESIEKGESIIISQKCECGHWDFEHPTFVTKLLSKGYEKPCKNCKCNNFVVSTLEQQNKALTEQVKELEKTQKRLLDELADEMALNHKFGEQVKQLQEERDLLYKDIKEKQYYLMQVWAERDNLKSERDQLKSKIEEEIKLFDKDMVTLEVNESEIIEKCKIDNYLMKFAVRFYVLRCGQKLKEILGENDKK